MIEEKIKEYFELNYEMMRYEAGHDITQDIREIGLKQVLFYWQKLNAVAERVTETEVKLALPNMLSPENRRFTIEGVVDIIREDNETWMYDIKTHDLDYIQHNIELYEKQLNIYAYIWQGLRGNQLDHTSIISTALPRELREADKNGPPERFDIEFKKWNPVVDIKLEKEKIEDLIADFGSVVDEIENNHFQPHPHSYLKKPAVKNSRENFGTRVCRNCDVRFSCSSYREYAAASQGKNLYNFRQFWIDPIPDAEQEEWLEENMNNEQIEAMTKAADELN
jgi:hypothetical protein